MIILNSIVHSVAKNMRILMTIWTQCIGKMKINETTISESKGRRLQQQFRELLIEELNIHPEDIESRSMGAGGEDLIMARAREKFPYSIECKNVEKLNVWEAYKQAEENSKDYKILVVMKKNNHKTLVVLDAEHFVKIHKDSDLSKYRF